MTLQSDVLGIAARDEDAAEAQRSFVKYLDYSAVLCSGVSAEDPDAVSDPRRQRPRFRVGAAEAEAACYREREAVELVRGRSMGSNVMLQAALDFIESGFAVIALKPRSKEPLYGGIGSPILSIATAVARWSQHPDANVGVLTGWRWNLVVPDIDGPDGEASWASWCAEHGELITRESITGRPDGGRHLWTAPEDDQLPDDAWLKGGTNRLGPGLDVKADGGYIVAPPSVHPSGARYRWVDAKVPIAATPQPILDFLREEGTTRQSSPSVAVNIDEIIDSIESVPTTSWGRAALNSISEELGACLPGGRDEMALKKYTRVGSLVASGHVNVCEGLIALAKAMDANGLGQAQAKIHGFVNGLRRGANHPVGQPAPRRPTIASGLTTAQGDEMSAVVLEEKALQDDCRHDTPTNPEEPCTAGEAPTSGCMPGPSLRAAALWATPIPPCESSWNELVLESRDPERGEFFHKTVRCSVRRCKGCNHRRCLEALTRILAGIPTTREAEQLYVQRVSIDTWGTVRQQLYRSNAQWARIPVGGHFDVFVFSSKELSSEFKVIDDIHEFQDAFVRSWYLMPNGQDTDSYLTFSDGWREPKTTRSGKMRRVGLTNSIAPLYQKVRALGGTIEPGPGDFTKVTLPSDHNEEDRRAAIEAIIPRTTPRA